MHSLNLWAVVIGTAYSLFLHLFLWNYLIHLIYIICFSGKGTAKFSIPLPLFYVDFSHTTPMRWLDSGQALLVLFCLVLNVYIYMFLLIYTQNIYIYFFYLYIICNLFIYFYTYYSIIILKTLISLSLSNILTLSLSFYLLQIENWNLLYPPLIPLLPWKEDEIPPSFFFWEKRYHLLLLWLHSCGMQRHIANMIYLTLEIK